MRRTLSLGTRELVTEAVSPWSETLRRRLRVGCPECKQPISPTYSCCDVDYRGAWQVPMRVVPTDGGYVAVPVEDLEAVKDSLPAGEPVKLERLVPVADLAAAYLLTSPVLLIPWPESDRGLYLSIARALHDRREAALGRGVIGRMPRRIAVLGFPGRTLAAYTLMDLAEAGDPAYDPAETAEPNMEPLLAGLRSGDLAYPADADPVEVFLRARLRMAQEATSP